MPSGTSEFYVQRRPEDVFAFVSDLSTSPQWVPDLVSMRKLTEGPIGVGTRYIETVQVGEKREDAQIRVTQFDPPRVFAHSGEGAVATFTGRFTLEPEGDGTRVRHEFDVRMKGLYWLLTPFVGGFVSKNTAASLARLQKILATGSSCGGPVNKVQGAEEDPPEYPE